MIYSYTGPRKGFIGSAVLALTGNVLLQIFWTNTKITTIFIVMAKFGVTSSFNMSFIAFVQLIPTIYSTTLFGFANFCARIVTMIAPVVAVLNYPVPLLTNHVLFIILIVSAVFIKEK